MKNFFLFLLIISLFFSCSSSEESNVKDSFEVFVEVLFKADLNQEHPFQEAAPLVLYSGQDYFRRWRDNCNYEKPEEQKIVDKTCFKLIKELGNNKEYIILSYHPEHESEGLWHVLKIQPASGKTSDSFELAFMEVKGNYLIILSN